MQLETEIAGLKLEHPVMNAAGTCKLFEGDHGVGILARSAASAIMVGSITLEERAGNQGNVYVFDHIQRSSLNALGLPCRGKEYYIAYLPAMVQVAHDAGKPLCVSIAGFSPQEYRELAAIALKGGADLIEVNLGCPNIWKDGVQKRIASFSPEVTALILEGIETEIGRDARVAVKISPFSDPWALADLAGVLADQEIVKIVTTMNTFPNAFGFAMREQAMPLITVGYAGLAGPAVKPIGLGQVKQLRALLPDRIQLIGVGGVTKGNDVKDYLAVGATCTQVATTLLEEGPEVFSRILQEMVD